MPRLSLVGAKQLRGIMLPSVDSILLFGFVLLKGVAVFF